MSTYDILKNYANDRANGKLTLQLTDDDVIVIYKKTFDPDNGDTELKVALTTTKAQLQDEIARLNTERQSIIDFIAIENGLSEISTNPPVPTRVTMAQARKVLIVNDLLHDVNNTIASLAGKEGELARTDWEYSTTVDRESVLVQSITNSLGFTSKQLDSLFTQAAML